MLDDKWRVEEVAQFEDLPLAQFYWLLDNSDRALFLGMHVDIHGDLREQSAPAPAPIARFLPCEPHLRDSASQP
jgi:hypothetical protein